MKIRPAKIEEFDKLYKIGLNTPELQVSTSEKFMDEDDLRQRINSPIHIFLVAENKGKIAGFICANMKKDSDTPLQNRYACLVYLVTVPEFRNQGVAQQLYDECIKILKKKGITHVYSWANAEGTGAIIKFFKKQGLTEGHKYVWMDRKL